MWGRPEGNGNSAPESNRRPREMVLCLGQGELRGEQGTAKCFCDDCSREESRDADAHRLKLFDLFPAESVFTQRLNQPPISMGDLLAFRPFVDTPQDIQQRHAAPLDARSAREREVRGAPPQPLALPPKAQQPAPRSQTKEPAGRRPVRPPKSPKGPIPRYRRRASPGRLPPRRPGCPCGPGSWGR